LRFNIITIRVNKQIASGTPERKMVHKRFIACSK